VRSVFNFYSNKSMDTKNENEEWQNSYQPDNDANRDGNRISAEESESINRSSFDQQTGERPHRPRINSGYRNAGTYRPRFNSSDSADGGQRPYRPRYNSDNAEGGERPAYRPRYNNGGEDGGQRPYRPRYNSDNAEGGERPAYRPRYNNGGEDGGQRPYRPRYNNGGGYNRDNADGGQRPFRPRYNNGGGYNRDNADGGQRPFRPRYNNGGGYNRDNGGEGGQRPFRPRFNGGGIRLNKYLANAGICSRREADEYIQAGVVSVNGTVVTELGTKVKRSDEVKFHDQDVKIERKIYVC
jgi:23S rRNA pseudouridine2605 synthase